MTTQPSGSPEPGILLVDDGELDDVARVLDDEAVPYKRLRGGQIPNEVAPPRDLLIVTPRRVERVRRGSPADAKPGRPLRIIAVAEDSPAMRRRLRRSGLHLLIRLPASREIWRLLVARALYRGSERRADPRVAVVSPIQVAGAKTGGPTVLVDLSNRGCRLQTHADLAVGDAIEFTIPRSTTGLADTENEPLTLRGEVRRLVRESDAETATLAVVFDPDLEPERRTRLTALINHWASGPCSLDATAVSGAPAIPPCQLPSLPDLTLDDETDPPVLAATEIAVDLATTPPTDPDEDPRERRRHARGHYASSIVAESENGPFVLIGRDLSSGGMRIEAHPDLHVGDRFQLALHGPTPDEPILVRAEIVRDDGHEGLGVVFDSIDDEHVPALEKMVACLPDVESLEDGELAGLGAILSEIVPEA